MVIMNDASPILIKPLPELTFSPEFLKMAEANYFVSLNDIVKFPTYELLKKPQFGYRMLLELMSVLRENNLLGLLKE